MEVTEMRRSTLQRKDRDELTQIAEALGKRPGSRARKGEIIDLILDLAAGGDGAGVAGEDNDLDGSDNRTEATAEEAAGESDGDASAKRQKNDDGAGSGDSVGPAGSIDGDDADRPEPGNRRRRRRGRDRDNRSDGNEHWDGEPIPVQGHLDLRSEGYGFLRVNDYLPSRDDAYVPVKLVRQHDLRKGDVISGPSRPANRNEKNPALLSVETVNGEDPGEATKRPNFDDLTPVHPSERLVMEITDESDNLIARIVDLVAPIGKGQRGLIVSPPRAGKTNVVKQIVRSIETNHPEVTLIVAMIDERPEEVTDMKRWLSAETTEVVASTFDKPADEHVAIADLTIERAKRLVEEGNDVCVVLDGMTRLCRASNLETAPSGKTLPGAVDAAALFGPKKLLGAARKVEEGGSLTIIATAVVDSGSQADEVIFDELMGTANMELRLNRSLAERRIYPAIDVERSSTRHDELLFTEPQLGQVAMLRRVLGELNDEKGPAAGLGMLLERLTATKSNEEFLAEVAKSASGS
ncbi:MAG: transcription termination factor Rho [Acidimicrobiales bacterium]